MKIPEFKNDQEMAAWFEANDVAAADLEVADDVAIAPDLVVTLVAEVGVYSTKATSGAGMPGTSASSTSSGPRDLKLKPVPN